MKLFVDISGDRHEVELPVSGDVDHLEIDGKDISIDYQWLRGDSVLSMIIDGVTYTAQFNPDQDWCHIQVEGHDFKTLIHDERSESIHRLIGATISRESRGREIRAPMPGLIVKLLIAEGDSVVKGQGVIVVEAMKMENEIHAQTAGMVEKINVKTGQAVNKGELLITLKPDKLPDDGVN